MDTYWLVPLFGYKLILQFIATVLALLLCTVQVEIKTLDDSRYTQAITYVNMVVLALAVALAFAVNNFENAKAAVQWDDCSGGSNIQPQHGLHTIRT